MSSLKYGPKRKVSETTVGRGKNRKTIPIYFQTVELSEAEDRERIERLARKILRVAKRQTTGDV